MTSILMVDDDVALCTMLAEYLAPEEFLLHAAYDGERGLLQAQEQQYSALILDVMLPRIGGFELLRRLRAANIQTPVLMLTARGDEVDRIVGLELGADDYLPKPFNPRELCARLRAILRRTSQAPSLQSQKLSTADLELDLSARRAKRNGKFIDLTTAEFDLLKVLLQQAGQVVARETIAQQVFGRKLLRFDRTVDMHVSNLRKKIGPYKGGQERIVTVRGAGYMLALPTQK